MPNQNPPVAADGARKSAAERDPLPAAHQAFVLMEIVKEEAELFHTPERAAYATVAALGRRETWHVRSPAFRRWLARRFHGPTGEVPRRRAVEDVLDLAEGLALASPTPQPVFLRKAEQDGALYLDLANERGEVVEITGEGWEIRSQSPVRFRRPEGMLPLPVPIRGGSIQALRPFVNVARDGEFHLLVAWLLAVLGPSRPYPLLGLHGEQGSARRTTARVLRMLVDPNEEEPCAEARRPRELARLADRSLVVVLENLRAIPEGLADALSRLATGGVSSPRPGAAGQTLRPVLWTGLGEFPPAADQVDRTLTLRLPPLPVERRRREGPFWDDFRAAWPGLLGALLDGVAAGLHELPGIRHARLSRVPDFLCWGIAAERGLGWKPGTFLAAYEANRGEATREALDAFPMADAILRLVADEGEWLGTCRELLPLLAQRAAAAGRERKGWPASPEAMAHALRRMQAHLGAAGVAMIFSRTGSARLVRLAPCGPARGRRPDAHDGSAEWMTVQPLTGDELSCEFVAGSDGVTVCDGFSANGAHASTAPGRGGG